MLRSLQVLAERADKDPATVDRALAYAVTHGLVYSAPAAGDINAHRMTHAPLTLLPMPFPKSLFDQVTSLAPLFSSVIDRVARNAAFLEEQLRATAAADPLLTGRLLDLQREFYLSATPPQPLMLGLFRADYMINAGSSAAGAGTAVAAAGDAWGIQQIEINTISSAFAGLSPAVAAMHQYTASRLLPTPEGLEPWKAAIPVSASSSEFPAGIARAFRAHPASPSAQDNEGPSNAKQSKTAACEEQASPLNADAHVLMVVQEGETNTGDQRILEQELWERWGIPLLRRSLQAIALEGSLRSDGCLEVHGVPCFVAYFRAGYRPEDYLDEACWEARRLIERSTAVKCPSIPYHLAGTKKIQQVLAQPDTLRRFCSEEEACRMEAVFAQQVGLEDEVNNNTSIADAIAHPDDWVLKPQREGGGTLVTGTDLVALLQRLTPALRAEYVLMRKVRPPQLASVLVRNGAAVLEPAAIAELGIFAVFLSNGSGEPLVNKAAGHLLRSKPAHKQDGGVAAGTAYLDSPALV